MYTTLPDTKKSTVRFLYRSISSSVYIWALMDVYFSLLTLSLSLSLDSTRLCKRIKADCQGEKAVGRCTY